MQTPEDCAAYVQAAIDEAGDDPAFIVKAIGVAGNSSFGTVFRLIRALGLEVKLQAATACP